MGLSTTLLASATPTDGFTGWVVSVMETLGEPGAGLLVALENLFPPIPSEVILPLAGFSNACAQASQLLSVFLNQYSTTARRASVVNPLFHHALPMQ